MGKCQPRLQEGEDHARSCLKAYEENADFAKLWDDALEVACDAMEEEARRRAMEGTKKPVFYLGKVCGHIKEYSDTLLIFQLKAHRPEKYRERVGISDDKWPDDAFTKLSPDELHQVVAGKIKDDQLARLIAMRQQNPYVGS